MPRRKKTPQENAPQSEVAISPGAAVIVDALEAVVEIRPSQAPIASPGA